MARTVAPSSSAPPARPAPGAPVRRRRRASGQPLGLWAWTALVFVYLFAPIVVVVIYSFNAGRTLGVFDGFSLRWYRTFLNDQNVISSLRVSLEIAAVTTVIGTVLGTMLALGLMRTRSRASGIAGILMLLPLVTPEIVTAIALLILFTQAGVTLSLTTVFLGHITFSIAYVTVVVRGRLALLNPQVEEAALDLGATHLGALLRITVPALRPAIIGSALLVFVLSFDDFVTSYFTSGNGVSPLPVVIYGMIKYGVTPEINAIGTLMLAITLVLLAVAFLVAGRSYRGLNPPSGDPHA